MSDYQYYIRSNGEISPEPPSDAAKEAEESAVSEYAALRDSQGEDAPCVEWGLLIPVGQVGRQGPHRVPSILRSVAQQLWKTEMGITTCRLCAGTTNRGHHPTCIGHTLAQLID